MATRVRREVTAVGESAAATQSLPRVTADASGRVLSSDVAWIKRGDGAAWIGTLARPAFLGTNGQVWLAVPERGARAVRLLRLDDARFPVAAGAREPHGLRGLGVSGGRDPLREGNPALGGKDDDDRVVRVDEKKDAEAPARRPAGAPAPGRGAWDGEWIRAYYLETVANAAPCRERRGPGRRDPEGAKLSAQRRGAALRAGRQGDRQGAPRRLHRRGRSPPGRLPRRARRRVRAGGLDRAQRQPADPRRPGGLPRRLLGADPVAVARPDRRPRPLLRRHGGVDRAVGPGDGPRQKVDAEIAMARTIQQKLLPPPEARAAGVLGPRAQRAGRRDRRRLLRLHGVAGRAHRSRRSATSPGTGCRRACSSAWRRRAWRPSSRPGYRDGELFAPPERAHPPFDGSAPLHDARSPRLRRGDAPRAR